MLNGTNTALYQYPEWYDRRFRLSDWLVDKVSSGLMHSENDLRSVLLSVKLILFGLSAIAVDVTETSRKRKKLCAILRCSPEEIAMDVNELAQKREHIKYYGGDFTYSAAVAKGWMKNIRLIFGDAHLEALDETSCLGNLESVWGNVYFSKCTDFTGLKQLAFVNGNISYQGKRFLSLQDFYRFLQQ